MNILTKAISLSLCMAVPGVVFAATAEPPPDITRKELATALINYEAQARLKEYELSKEKFFMMAPGSPEAIQAGKDTGKEASLVSQNALDASKDAVQGDNNMADVMQEDVVAKATSQRIINLITNPNPKQSDVMLPGGAEIPGQAGVDSAIESILMSVAANALGEIAAKRQKGDTDKSLAQILREESERRFTSVDWYKNIGVSSDSALLRELAHMESFSLLLQYQTYRLQEQNASLLAAMLSSMAKMTKTMNALSKAMGEMEQVDLDDIDTGDIEIPDI